MITELERKIDQHRYSDCNHKIIPHARNMKISYWRCDHPDCFSEGVDPRK